MQAAIPGTRVRVKLDGFNHDGVKITGRMSTTGTVETINTPSRTIAVKLDISFTAMVRLSSRFHRIACLPCKPLKV
jgi:hypothetical protein